MSTIGASSLRAAINALGLPDLQAAYLFGSSAHGTMHRDSDIDIGVLTARGVTPEERFELQEKLAARLGRDVDLVDMRRASTVMATQVVSSGTLLIDREPDARAEFEMLTYASYARLNEERRQILAAIAETGSVYDR